MLAKMCKELLTNADIKEICKNRGFSTREVAASRSIFENLFLSDLGIETVLSSLSYEEIILLYILGLERKPVDICFFERVYHTGKSDWSSSFTQKYESVYKKVQHSYIRKGVLVVSLKEQSFGATKSKMERWRFCFPEEFKKFLPPIIKETIKFTGKGNVCPDIFRQRLQALPGGSKTHTASRAKYQITINKGLLFVGNKQFTKNNLQELRSEEWNDIIWDAEIEKREKRCKNRDKHVYDDDSRAVDHARAAKKTAFPQIILNAFEQLLQDEWAGANQFSILLGVLYYKSGTPDITQICEQGWRLGILARYTVDQKDFYKLVKTPQEGTADPNTYLKISNNGFVSVDLAWIPFTALEHLGAITQMKIENSSLIIAPDIISIGKANETILNHTLTFWLKENTTIFKQAIEKITKQQGRQIVHTNLLIARVKDLSLKVRIQKAFPDPNQVAVLPDNYLAFPKGLSGDIRKLVNKSGYVIKEIKANTREV